MPCIVMRTSCVMRLRAWGAGDERTISQTAAPPAPFTQGSLWIRPEAQSYHQSLPGVRGGGKTAGFDGRVGTAFSLFSSAYPLAPSDEGAKNRGRKDNPLSRHSVPPALPKGEPSPKTKRRKARAPPTSVGVMPQGGAELRQPRRSNPKGPPQNLLCGSACAASPADECRRHAAGSRRSAAPEAVKL